MEEIAIGRVRTSHGVRGFLKVLSFSGQSDHFLKLKEITLKKEGRERTFSVEAVRPASGGVLMKLTGIDSPESGRNYTGWEIWVNRKFAAPLEPGEYYVSDLNGCRIMNNGSELGVVIGVSETSINDILEVRTDSGVYIVPFKEEFVGDVDLVSRKIELKADWLLK